MTEPANYVPAEMEGQKPARRDTFFNRRTMAAGLGVAAASMVLTPKQASASNSTALQNLVNNGADPTGVSDSSPAFATAFNKLPASGGIIYCPAGVYKLMSPVTFSNKPLAVYGEGSAGTMFAMDHTGTAFTFNSTAMYASSYPFQVQGVGIAGPTSAGPAAGAIAVNFPYATQETGYQSCFLSDIDIGISLINKSNGCNISLGLSLQNIWKSVVSNVRMFGPFGSGTFVELGSTPGMCVDNTFVNCFVDGPYYAYVVGGYCEGVHIINTLAIAQVGFTSRFGTLGATNILGLFISGSEFNTFSIAADIYNVVQSYISDTHFNCGNQSAAAVVALTSCVAVRMSNLAVEGNYNTGTGAGGSTFGINFGGAQCLLNGALFMNLKNGAQFLSGAAANLALGLQLIDQSNYPHLQSGPAAIDNSGNVSSGANNAQWQIDSGQLRTLR